MAFLNVKDIESMDDIMSEIHTFLTSTLTNTWNSVDGIDTGANTLDLDEGGLFIQFTWDDDTINMSQSTASSSPVKFDGETGNVGFNSVVQFEVNVTNAELWIFASDTATASDQFAHCVVEINKDGRFMHFGFGNIPAANKFFPWTGGAYKYGGDYDELNNGHEPASVTHRIGPLDSAHTNTNKSNNLATMRCSSLRDQNTGLTTPQFLAFSGTESVGNIESQTDDAGNNISAGTGFCRHGPHPAMAAFQETSPNNAAVHLIPILFAWHESAKVFMPLGTVPEVAIVNIGSIQPKQELTFDGDDWIFFPWAEKLTITTDQDTIATRNAGLAYKKVT